MNRSEIFGWYGMTAILGAYALLSFGFLSSGLIYQILNGTGALGIAIISFKKGVRQPGVLNAIWTLIAAVSILRIIF